MPPAPSPAFEIPKHLGDVFARFVAAEYAYYTPRGEPLCWPVTPYWYSGRSVVGVATGLAYPNKADYAKRNPQVSLLFSDPASSGLRDPPQVLLQGRASVLDEDLQANTDRYVAEIRAKFPAARLALNPLSVKFLDFYLPRLWVEVTPVRLLVWPDDGEPEVIGAPLPPAEAGAALGAPEPPPADELAALRDWAVRCGSAAATVRGPDGYPLQMRTPIAPRGDGSLTVEDAPGIGPACLTFHYLKLGGVQFDALMARGTIVASEHGHVFAPRRVVGFFNRQASRGNPFLSVFPLSVIPRAMELRKRLHQELERRGQTMPRLRIP